MPALKPFSSSVLRELLKKIRDRKMQSPAQKWASHIENTHAVELIEEPCVMLPSDEFEQAHRYLNIVYKAVGEDLVKAFSGPTKDTHLAKFKQPQATLPDSAAIHETMEVGTIAHRDARNEAKVDLPIVKMHSTPAIASLPSPWQHTLNNILSRTNCSETVAHYNQVPITRADIATIVPTREMERAKYNSPKGWVNDSMIDIFLRIVSAARNKRDRKQSTVVINSFVVQKLHHTDPKASAKKAGLDISSLSSIDLILFPTHFGGHWILIVASPQTRTLENYDSMKTGKTSPLAAVHRWIRDATGESWSGEWHVKEPDCPQQLDGSICGICVCVNALLVAIGFETSGAYSPREDDEALRRFVAVVVCKGELPYPMPDIIPVD